MSRANCPECGARLAKKNKCICGWHIKHEEQRVFDGRCCYEIDGRRCVLPGTCSASRNSSIWYCSDHSMHLGDEEKCREILIYSEKNYDKIIEKRLDWRRKLFPEDFKINRKKPVS